MRVLVLGAEGMLGHKMSQVLSARYPDTYCTLRGSLDQPFYGGIDLFKELHTIERVDALDLLSLGRVLSTHRPDFIVNCIGVIKQREEATAAIPSLTINSLLPHWLSLWATAWGGRVIHFSTDCVFSGRKGQYTETDPSDAEDLYGKSKFLGEVATHNALTLRTSIIGRELAEFKSLLEWFLAQRGRTVRGFTRVIYAGVTTNYLSELVGDIIERHPSLSGVYQVTSPPISKYHLLTMLKDAYRLDVTILRDDAEVSDRSMVGSRFREVTGFPEPRWDELSHRLASDATPYDTWRGRTSPNHMADPAHQ